MVESMWMGIIAQIPVVASFMLFMLIWQKRQNEATNRENEGWQRWLDRVIENSRVERDAWRAWLAKRDSENAAAMQGLTAQVRQQTSVILAMVAREGGDVDKIIDALDKLQNTMDKR